MTVRTKKQIQDYLAERDGLVCGICELSLEPEWQLLLEWRINSKSHRRTRINIDIDHKLPYSVTGGGRWDNLENLRLTHRTCNHDKANMII